MLDFKEMLLCGEGQHIKCANCIYYKGGDCRLNPLAVAKEADYSCGRFVAMEDSERPETASNEERIKLSGDEINKAWGKAIEK